VLEFYQGDYLNRKLMLKIVVHTFDSYVRYNAMHLTCKSAIPAQLIVVSVKTCFQ